MTFQEFDDKFLKGYALKDRHIPFKIETNYK